MKLKHYSVIALTCFFITGCDKKMDLNQESETINMTISTSIVDFSNQDIKASQGTTIDNTQNKDTLITLSDNLMLKAELTTQPIDNHYIPEKNINKANSSATTPPLLGQNIWCKLIIYKNGEYVEERDYQYRAGPQSGEPLTINRGANYTFVAYSVNSTDLNDLPELIGPPTGKTLSNTSISVDGYIDFLYFKKEIVTRPSQYNIDLQIILKHQFNEIGLEMNSNATKDVNGEGYHLKEVIGNFLVANSMATKDIGTDIISRSGPTNNSSFTLLATTDKYKRALSPRLINVASGGSLIELTKIVLEDYNIQNNYSTKDYTIYSGPNQNIPESFRIQQPIKPFSNLTLLPGYRYNIKLSLVNDDRYLIHANQQAVSIAGHIWMANSLGATYTGVPNNSTQITELYGNYYQFGQPNPISNDSKSNPTYSSAPTNWKNTPLVTNSTYNNWNNRALVLNNEHYFTQRDYSQKNLINDPCPNGYRIPSAAEWLKLVTHTWDTFENGRAILISKRKKGVSVILPLQGRYVNVPNTGDFNNIIESKSTHAQYWSNQGEFYSGDNTAVTSRFRTTITNISNYPNLDRRSNTFVVSAGTNDTYNSSNFNAVPIRCIAIAQGE